MFVCEVGHLILQTGKMCLHYSYNRGTTCFNKKMFERPIHKKKTPNEDTKTIFLLTLTFQS